VLIITIITEGDLNMNEFVSFPLTVFQTFQCRQGTVPPEVTLGLEELCDFFVSWCKGHNVSRSI